MPIYPTKTVDYNFDNPACYSGSGTTVYDLQGNLDLNFVGTPTFTSSPGNGSYFSFEDTTASSDHLESSASTLLNGSYNFSYAYVIKPQSDATVNPCYAGIKSPGYTYQNATNLGISDPSGDCWNYAGDNQTFANPFPVGSWSVVVVTFDQTNDQMKVYLNGTLETTLTPLTLNPFTFYNPVIQLGFNSIQAGQAASSDIKAFSFWKNVVLTGPQVIDYTKDFILYTNPPVMDLNASVSASYPGSGTTWFDLTAGNYDFTMYSPAFTAKTVSSPGYFSFPGRASSDPLTVYGEYNGTPAITTESAWTDIVWVRRSSLFTTFNISRLSIFANGREDLGSNANGWASGTMNQHPTLNSDFMIESSGYGIFDSGSGIPDDEWVMLSFVRSGGDISFYLNGSFISTTSFNYSTPSAGMWISRTANSLFSWIGDISIIRQFDVALNATQINSVFENDLANYIIDVNPPTLQLHLDAGNPASYLGSGTSWNDLTANNFDYTMVNPLYSPTEGGYFTFVSPGDGNYPVNYGFKDNLGPITTAQTDITMQCWIRVPAQPGGTIDGVTVFTNGNEGPGYGYYQSIQWNYYAFSGRMPGLNITGTAGYFATDVADAFPTDAWTLFTITVDSSNNLKIYYNDTLMETFTGVSMGTAPDANAQLYIGTNNNSNGYPKAFNGDMAVLRFYDGALDAATIANQYTNEVGRFANVVSKTLELDATNVSSYSGTGNTWYDLTANNNDVELFGNTTWTNVLGVKSFDFDGTNSYAYNASVSVGATNNFTIDSWFKISDTQANQFIHCLGTAAANTFPLLSYNVTGVSAGVYGEMGGGTAGTTIIASPTLETWYNVTMTADGTDVKYYVDGSLQSTVSQGSGAIPSSSVELSIGNHVPSPSFPSWLDGNVGYYAVYDGAIGATTVAANYTTNLPKFTPSSPPVYNGNVGGRQFGQGFNG